MRPSVIAAVALLSLVALSHLARLLLQVEVKVGETIVPMWVSGLACVVAGVVALWLWRESISATRGVKTEKREAPKTPRKSISNWLTDHEQKPAELWREILGQLRQLSTDVWNGVRFFVTVNAVVLGATFSVANQQPRGGVTAAILFALGLLGLFFTLAARRILQRQRAYYLKILAQKVLFEEEVGLYDIGLAGSDLHLSVPWSVEKVHLEEIKKNPEEWERVRARASGTVTRILFLIYDGVLIVYLVLLLTFAWAFFAGTFRQEQPRSAEIHTPSNNRLETDREEHPSAQPSR